MQLSFVTREPDKVYAANQNLSTNGVIFWGRADKYEMKNLMKGCEVFVIPSRKEPFGIVALEAFAAGKYVVAANTGGLAEIVQDGINGYFVEAGNVEDLVGGIIKALSDTKRNIQINLSENSWGKMSLKYMNIFETVKI